MPTYNVTLRRRIRTVRTEFLVLPIEAGNEDDARDIVYEKDDPAVGHTPDWDEYEDLDEDWGIVLVEEEN